MERCIMHVDMDAFFASVEQRDHEEYRGRPVIVGGLSPRGVVATASYEARRFGVHSAMPMEQARKRCPQGVFVSGRHAHYREVSAQIFAVFARFSPVVEPLSIDEAFLDLTGMERLMASPAAYARKLKAAIRKETGLVASMGVAPNKFLAKLASDLQKPDGLVVIERSHIQEVLWPLPIRRLWGAGPKTTARLRLMGYETIGQLAGADRLQLRQAFGPKLAGQLVALANGNDDRPVVPAREAQSIGNENTFLQDIHGQEAIDTELLALAEKVAWRLRQAKRRARTIQLKVRLADFTTYTRSRTLVEGTCYDEVLYQMARELYQELHVRGAVRLLGITGSNFDPYEASLFSDTQKQQELYGAIDDLKKRFGSDIIRHLGRAGKAIKNSPEN